MADEKVKVMKVRVDEAGPFLIIGEDEKDELWSYCEDWIGKMEITFTTMTQAEIDALPEFEGF